ncbi:Bsc6p SKDI_15G0240 [Saccharomyces kudriavzevii IFO 1802]|uniref:Major facilitator superfamily (MFS) profile domain-containing protein n=1 Tax=Saccharomyces kudriavzevii (strain ATCC MYA-4449 / AS 2.2408 / CBS 8840 / NBRC 1802 / NCYC 2889) TaxID=226230 RepID=A0AA35J864_SACK1|nr:uncharacterized protein SKDI_15G0240 [Saccharomyces kudriavzevii IFO 1802]CAI4050751.1 hypothetical protein SKDI_15G0240 [Saccharomyces kudriavzevii IFO 1802]
MDASSIALGGDDYGMHTTEISHHNTIELKNLLSPSESREDPQDSDGLPSNSSIIKEIEWNGEMVKTYPLNYQTVPLVKLQVMACLIMFIVFGMNDQTVGALLPTLIEYYHITQVDVSNVFIVQLCGYVMASLSNERLNKHFGMRGGMLLAATLCIVFLIVLASAPSNFYVCMFCGLPLGLGIGILDSTGNVLMGSLLVHKNELMGIMHGLYGAAAMVTPPLVSHFVEWGHWSLFFLIPLFFSIIGMIIIFPAFKFETANKYDYICSMENKENSNDIEDASVDLPMESPGASPGFFTLLRNPAISLYSLYLFLYLGAEITTGSWFFSYLLQTKSSNKVAMSYIAASFWTGLTVGRLCLGFVTERFFENEYKASKAYAFLTLSSYTLFVLVGLIDSDSSFYFFVLFLVVFSCGTFIGPLFPNASIVALQVLPKRLHVSGVGVAVAVGGCGGAAIPYLAGVIAHTVGIQYIPLLCWIMVALFTLEWTLYPKFIKGHAEFF